MKKFVELCEVFDLVQHVREPTHIKGHIVDFILNRSTDKLGIENVRICDLISDHFLVCCNIALHKPPAETRTLTYRNLKSIDTDDFKKDITKLPVSQSFKDINLDELTTAYDTQMRELLDKHAPIITRKTSSKRRDPWITEEILEALRAKRKAERRYKKSKSTKTQDHFRLKRDSFEKLLSESESNYLDNMIRQNSHDPKMLCKSLNAVMYKTKENPLPPHTSAKKLANDFNNFFKSKVDQIRENFSDDTIEPYEYDSQFNGIALEKFAPVQIEDIIQIIKKLPCLQPLTLSIIRYFLLAFATHLE